MSIEFARLAMEDGEGGEGRKKSLRDNADSGRDKGIARKRSRSILVRPICRVRPRVPCAARSRARMSHTDVSCALARARARVRRRVNGGRDTQVNVALNPRGGSGAGRSRGYAEVRAGSQAGSGSERRTERGRGGLGTEEPHAAAPSRRMAPAGSRRSKRPRRRRPRRLMGWTGFLPAPLPGSRKSASGRKRGGRAHVLRVAPRAIRASSRQWRAGSRERVHEVGATVASLDVRGTARRGAPRRSREPPSPPPPRGSTTLGIIVVPRFFFYRALSLARRFTPPPVSRRAVQRGWLRPLSRARALSLFPCFPPALRAADVCACVRRMCVLRYVRTYAARHGAARRENGIRERRRARCTFFCARHGGKIAPMAMAMAIAMPPAADVEDDDGGDAAARRRRRRRGFRQSSQPGIPLDPSRPGDSLWIF